MRTLHVDTSQDLVTPDVLSALQLRTGNDPLLPKLEVFQCQDATEAFIQLIPLFLSRRTIFIDITFTANPLVVTLASMIVRLPILCPEVQWFRLTLLPRNPVIKEAVSEMLLACNRNTLQGFLVDSPLTEEARGVLYNLPNLCYLWTVIEGQTSLPPVVLPRLTSIFIEYDRGSNWLQAFRRATLGELDSVTFEATSRSFQIRDFLGEFTTVALAASAQNTLSSFTFRTSQSWNPKYSALLVFKELKILEIDFSCHDGCSSRVDDEIVISLAKAMPKLENLRLGKEPCQTPTGITLKGLIALACHCPQLSNLCVHLRVRDLAEAPNTPWPSYPSEHSTVIPKASCALTDLQVGETPIQEREVSAVALTLVQVFPRLLNIGHVNPQWRKVSRMVKLFHRISGHVNHTSKVRLPRSQGSLLTCHQKIHSFRNSVGNRRSVTVFSITLIQHVATPFAVSANSHYFANTKIWGRDRIWCSWRVFVTHNFT
jgi:hypothetical protein